MLKKALLGLVVILAAAVVWQIVALVMLRRDVADYADYWQGRAEIPGDFVYVALGDSAAQGVGASAPDKGYVGLLADSISRQTGRRVHVINLSVSGAKLQDVLDHQLGQLSAYRPDLITMEIGANDMRTYDEARFRDQFERILRQLPADKTVVSTMPYFGGIIRPGNSPALASSVIAQLSQQYGMPLAELYQPLAAAKKQWIYAADVFHPNDTGYRIWHDAFYATIEPRLSRSD